MEIIMLLTGINHLAFITEDLEKTIRFYRDLLGMKLVAGIGHDGYRHYFLNCGNTLVAFFEYEGASPMKRKFPGKKTSEPMGFDHVSFTIGSREELFHLKDKLEAAGVEVHGAVDHGIIWSIYFFDPNNIPLEVSWDCMEILEAPAVLEEDPMAIVAEGADPRPASWPEVTIPTPVERMTAWPGNAYPMREALLANRQARVTGDYEAIPEAQRRPVERPEKVMAEAGV
jgi:catechol 2,3-dioxygenase-like lactoylglutathione lyase family enzyme